MRSSMRNILLSLPLALLVACGGGQATTGASPGTTTGAVPTTTTGAPTDDGEPTEGTATTTTTTGVVPGGGDFCELSRTFDQAFDEPDVDFTDPESVRAYYQDVGVALEQFAAAAPAELAADAQVVLQDWQVYLAALEQAGYDFTQVEQHLPEGYEESQDEVQAANERIETYLQDVCGIDTS